MKRIGITVGDPSGIGPEIITKSLSKQHILSLAKFTILGPPQYFEPLQRSTGVEFFWPEDIIVPNKLQPGVSQAAGAIAGMAVQHAIDLAMSRQLDAIVTAPISKEAFNLAGFHYPGHTEFLCRRSKSDKVVMMLLSSGFRVALATTHCPVGEITYHLNTDHLVLTLRLLHKDLKNRFDIPKPLIAVSALNPHAGEGGLFGNEEQNIIIPAIEKARLDGINVLGPFPADTLFCNLEKKKYDVYLAMYHDQGLIPLKMASFGLGVNYTVGLPFVRTSPDHGTAFDIAGKGIANSRSMEEAITLAVELATKEHAGETLFSAG